MKLRLQTRYYLIMLGVSVAFACAVTSAVLFYFRIHDSVLFVSIFSCGLAFLALVLAGYVTRDLVRPIHQLAAQADQIGRGEAAAAIPVSRNDEIGDLSRALQHLLLSFQRMTQSRDDLGRMIENMCDALIVTDAQGIIRTVNHSACLLLWYQAGELIGQPIQNLFDSEHTAACSDLMAATDASGPGQEDSLLRGGDGRAVFVSIGCSAISNEHGIREIVFVARNMPQRTRQEEDLHLAAKVFENISEGIMIMNHEMVILYVNPAFTSATGYGPGEVIGHNIQILVADSQGEGFFLRIMKRLQNTGRWEGEVWSRRKDERIHPEWLRISAIHNEAHVITHYAGMLLDISERKQAESRIYELAHYDHLTRLPNRGLMLDRLKRAMQKADGSGNSVGLLFLDLDRFKVINDTKGHKVGDQLLQGVARRLAQCIPDQDTLARLGGDEFAIILPQLKHAEAAAGVARQILDVFGKPFSLVSHRLFTGASIGISIYPADAGDSETLLRNADAAMYRAKEHGGNDYRFFTVQMNAIMHERMLLENGLRQALDREEFAVYYQPQWDIRTNRVVGVEALLRWRHPDLGVVLPEKFIPVAEDTGLIVPIGDWVLRTACQQQWEWHQQGLTGLHVAVNLSARQFHNPQMFYQVETILHETGLAPACLDLELTEGLLMDDVGNSIDMLMRLHKLGVQLSVDDFGTGYSSLSYLKKFPISSLKIDKSFIRDLTTNPDDAAIANAIIMLGQSLGLKVVAEGVEQQDQIIHLESSGCDRAQGFYLSRALSADRVTPFLRHRVQRQ